MKPDQSEIALHMPTLEEYASRACFILELGCGHGNGSTRALIRGLQRSPHDRKFMLTVDIDPDKPDPEEVPQVKYWAKVTGPSQEVATLVKAEDLLKHAGLQFEPDLIFIDTDHTFPQMKTELSIWMPPSITRTIWLFHDTWMWGRYNPMTDAILEFAAKHKLAYEDLSRESHGLGMMRKV